MNIGVLMTYRGFARGPALASCLTIISSLPLAAEPVPCAEGPFAVDAIDTFLGRHLCELAPKISDDLASCGLIQSRELVIEVVQELSHNIGNCLAWYDCDEDIIRLVDPDRFSEVIESDSAYAVLRTDVLLRNALVHELAHALAIQTAPDREIALVDQEYIAAAIELELMEPEWRDALLIAAPVSLPPKEGLIDIWIYALEPRKFATNAWQHFSLPENGCNLVRRIVRGEATFAGASR